MVETDLKKIELLTEVAKRIELKPVQSSNIAGLGYDKDSRLLKVAFKNADNFSTYIYENVEMNTFNRILEEGSYGRGVSKYIIRDKKYTYFKV